MATQELNERRLETRQKQIDIGKNTLGYQRYIRIVQKDKRKGGDPQTPNKYQVCSKRSWDGQIRKWRRLLHKYDPPPEEVSLYMQYVHHSNTVKPTDSIGSEQNDKV